MGKITGFLDYQRTVNQSLPPKERIQNFHEFHTMLSEEERREQGARCMNCGVPFCQSGMMLNGMATGCPLYNLIPEWNDEVYSGNMWHALARLLKTNSFPEFTGRVCPALCEVACVCGISDSPVTVKENELAIIENGFRQGYMKPRIPEIRTDKRVAVIGSGPAGLACADLLNRRGHSVTVYEKQDRPGGLLMYGIPNMKLEKSVVKRRTDLMQEEGVTFVTNADVGKTVSAQELLDQYDAVVLCCGAEQPRDLTADGREKTKGILFAVDFLSQNTKSYLDSDFADGNFQNAREKNVVIVGGGDTGNDCVGTVLRHGCKSVIQLEMMPKPPDMRTPGNPWPEYPRVCKTDYGQEEAIALFGKDPRVYSTTVKRIVANQNGEIAAVETVQVGFDDDRRLVEIPDTETTLPCDLLIIAAGFTGCKTYVAESFGAELTAKNVLKTGNGGYATQVPKVFAAGDVRRGQSLVVWAIREGRECAKEVDVYLTGYSNL